MAEPGAAGAKARPADGAAQSGAAAATWLWRLVAVQVLAWTAVPALVNLTPPTDTVESYLWGREWRLLTYKHPQMPGWILDILHRLTGSYVWGHFFAAQLMIALTFLAVYALGREMMGPRAALAGVLLLPVTGIFSWGTRQFNHDVAQMPFWAAIAWLLWVAARRDRMGWWVALGLVGGIGLYAKFQVALMLIFGLVWLVADRQARRRLAGPGPWVAMGLVVALAVPIFVQMARDDYMQLSYAFGRTGQTLVQRGRFYFIGVQLSLMILLPVALWSVGLIGRRPAPAAGPSRLADPQARGYLLWMGLGPISLLLLLSPFLGIAEAWSKPMYNLVGLVAIAFLGGRLAAPGMRRLLVWAFAMTLGTAAAYGAYAPAQCYLAHDLTHACLPSARIARTLESDWHARVPGPIGIVAGDEDMMMNVALFLPEAPSMFTQMNFAYAPWITPARIARQGMLVVWTRPENLPAAAQAWIAGRPVAEERFTWARGAPPLVVHYVIVPPEGATP